MSPGLAVLSVLFGMVALVLAWNLKRKEQLTMLLIGVVCAALRCLSALYASTQGQSFIQDFTSPPDWRFLALISGIVGTLIAIIFKPFFRKKSPGKAG